MESRQREAPQRENREKKHTKHAYKIYGPIHKSSSWTADNVAEGLGVVNVSLFDVLREKLEEKIKVTSLEIIVKGTKDKPYFEIKYKEVNKEYFNIGYGSYDLNNVFVWKDECFEIVNQVEQEHNNGWIPADNPPKDDKYILLSFENFSVPAVGRYEEDEEGGAYHLGDEDETCSSYELMVNAWQPLPEQYKD